eukprot:m.101812 g.101812  ORF g.101812 m.101812 type:complete len:80 (+) comp13209_c0_seq3:2918-3157(+)
MITSRCSDFLGFLCHLVGFALEMIPMASSIISPLDGEPLVIRVGIHAGPLMAGVGESWFSLFESNTFACSHGAYLRTIP